MVRSAGRTRKVQQTPTPTSGTIELQTKSADKSRKVQQTQSANFNLPAVIRITIRTHLGTTILQMKVNPDGHVDVRPGFSPGEKAGEL